MEICSCWWCTHECLQGAASVYSVLWEKVSFLKLPFSFIMSSSSISNASFSGIVKFTIVGGFNKINAY